MLGGLKDDILLCLIENKLYASWLLNIGSDEEKGDVNVFAKDEISNVLGACEIINKKRPEFIPKIRAELVRHNNGDLYPGYEVLYSGQYQLITSHELSEMNKFKDGIDMIDASKFTRENIGKYINYINSSSRSGKECFRIFDHLFNPDYELSCKDAEIISFFVKQLDFSKIMFGSMEEEDRKAVVEIMRKPLGLHNVESAKDFMRNVKCLIPELELKIVQTLNIDSYIEFINELNLVSDYAIEMILKYSAQYKLNNAVTQRLLELGAYEYYIIGKTLYEDYLEFPMKGVPDEEVLALYTDNSLIKDYFINNQAFKEIVMKDCLYKKFPKPCTKSMLKPFVEMRQTADFLEFVLETLSENEIKIYLKTLNEIIDEDNSVAISQILTTDKYIKYLSDEETFKHIEFRLWDNVKAKTGYKAAFTRKRNANIRK